MEGRADGLIRSPPCGPSSFCILWSFGFVPIFNTNYLIFRWQFPWFIFPLLFPRVLTSGRHISIGSTTSNVLNDGHPTGCIFAIVFFFRALAPFIFAYVHSVQSSRPSAFSVCGPLDYCNGQSPWFWVCRLPKHSSLYDLHRESRHVGAAAVDIGKAEWNSSCP
ncbi:hypothetical protein BJ322DRAFT_437690 [Thelephora terrestris]|uniref:Uncharacterized protein n=1 Tax=Thelephora terrestris TaxID=56493 RepID=A0A9P6HNX9_9AGAM|nr:hypothetical protein BJ322DRAFT_437690 [Thelephora terrestris]